jgi:hypothetical protein
MKDWPVFGKHHPDGYAAPANNDPPPDAFDFFGPCAVSNLQMAFVDWLLKNDLVEVVSDELCEDFARYFHDQLNRSIAKYGSGGTFDDPD